MGTIVICKAVFGTPAAAPETVPQQSRPSEVEGAELSEQISLAGGLACGIDIEMVENLPVVQDYWEDTFYTTTFTAAEIAYCLLQVHPPMHLTARWCAKEALKKCDPAYSHLTMDQLEVALTTTGAPLLQTTLMGRGNVSGNCEPVPYPVHGSGCCCQIPGGTWR
jgi:phosphopantetheinyl transferase (holo-ACP synthase)